MNVMVDTVEVNSINSWFYVAGDPTYSSKFYTATKFIDRSE